MRIIDGDALFEDLKECMKDSRLTPLQINGIALAATRIFEQPTIEPEREKGKWILGEIETGAFNVQYQWKKCPKCGWESSLVIPRNFCPNCGADMRQSNAD